MELSEPPRNSDDSSISIQSPEKHEPTRNPALPSQRSPRNRQKRWAMNRKPRSSISQSYSKKSEAPGDSVPDLATVTELETILRISRTQIYKHIRRAQLEPGGPGKRFEVRAILEAIVRHRQDDNRLKSSPELKQRKLEIETEILETRLHQLEGELVPLQDLRKHNFEIARTLRDRILGIPERLGSLLAAERDANKVENLLAAELRAILTTLAAELEDPEVEQEKAAG